MFKPLPLFIGLRYTRAKRRNHFISFISLISMMGIALGVTALITVLSVMNGFEKELRERILGMASHAMVLGYDGKLRNWSELADIAIKRDDVLGVAPYIKAEGMLTTGQQVSGTLIRGISPKNEPDVSEVGKKMLFGSIDDLLPGEFGIILGKDLARSLGVLLGDKVTLVAPQANITPAGILPRLKRFTVVGIFEVGMYEYDNALALLHIDDAARLFRMGDAVSGIRLKLVDIFSAPEVARELVKDLPGDYLVSDWTRQHANFFRALKIEKRMMFLILMLIVAVAAFNLVSTIVMLVTDKLTEIAILRTLGASPNSVMAIFMIQGTVIGTLGTIMGMVGGVSLALNVDTVVPFIESLFETKFLPGDVYYISEFPSDLHWDDVILISTVAFSLSLLATIYPAWRASKTQPAEALRYE
ncbi:MAG: lipoprotein-releasing ABC transporter permease subunit [Gammaproteobacteria bacterium]|nr:lipoprotein-releasing ABC transporter permease subunit [Gammaproteobacteria bacterium]